MMVKSFVTSVPELKKNDLELFNCLPTGRDNVVSSHQLARDMDDDQSNISFMVNRLRRNKFPIGSRDQKGYFIIRTADDLEETLDIFYHRMFGMKITIRDLQDSFETVRRIYG